MWKSITWNFSAKCLKAFETLKEAFTTAPALATFVLDALIIVETDASDYTIAAILSIEFPAGEIHPVAFHSRTLHAAELNYDTHDKELLAIFEAFTVWRHYLEGSAIPVQVFTDHKNLEYFGTTWTLTRRQARWSEFLSTFNLVIRFYPGKLGTKPDTLTRRWDIYPKEGESGYATMNLHNFRPIFMVEKLTESLRATYLEDSMLRTILVMDKENLRTDIRNSLKSDPIATVRLDKIIADPQGKPQWSVDDTGLLRLDNRIYVPDVQDLRLRVLQFRHDHPVSSHFGLNRALNLIHWDYTWPGLRTFITEYVNS